MNTLTVIGALLFVFASLFQIFQILQLKKVSANNDLTKEEKAELQNKVGKKVRLAMPFEVIGAALAIASAFFGN